MPDFHVTYEIVTAESAEHADAAERGFVLPGDSLVELPADVFGTAAGAIKTECALRLREAIELMGCLEGGLGDWYETDPRRDYHTGAETRYALHAPDAMTAASMARLECLLRKRKLLLHTRAADQSKGVC